MKLQASIVAVPLQKPCYRCLSSDCGRTSLQGPRFLPDYLSFVLPHEDLGIWLRAEFGSMLISLY